MRRMIGLVAGLLLAAACHKAAPVAPPLALAVTLQRPTVDSGGTVVVTFTATNPGTEVIRLSAPSSCVAMARIETATGDVVATPTMLCSEKVTKFQFPAGTTSQWDVGLDVRSPPGSYRVVGLLKLGDVAVLQDTMPLTVR